MPRPSAKEIRCLARLRVVVGREIALGPGKADLLQAIEEHGSIGAAARTLGMSYMRAWNLVRTMNGCFATPLVEAARGGAVRGGATLTARGRAILALYRRMEASSARAIEPDAKRLRAHLRPRG